MRSEASKHRRQCLLCRLRHAGRDGLGLDDIDAEPQIFERVGEFVLWTRLKPRLAIQQQGDAIEHPAGPLIARRKRAPVGKVGEITVRRAHQAPCAGLRADDTHEPRHRQPRKPPRTKALLELMMVARSAV